MRPAFLSVSFVISKWKMKPLKKTAASEETPFSTDLHKPIAPAFHAGDTGSNPVQETPCVPHSYSDHRESFGCLFNCFVFLG